jgi:hypothetical protein
MAAIGRVRRYRRPEWADEFEAAGHKIGLDGTIVVYHATTAEKAAKILESGMLLRPADAPDSYGVYFSISCDVAENYGDGTLVKLRVPVEDLHFDDVFPNGRMDFSARTHDGVYIPLELSVIPAGGGKEVRKTTSLTKFRRWLLFNRCRLLVLSGGELRKTKRKIELYEDQYDADEPGGGTVDDFDWYLTRGLPISLLGPRRTWAAWMSDTLRSPDGQKAWGWMLDVEADAQDPVIVVEGADGEPYVWDGNHRIGAAAMRKRETVMAFVGLRNN